MKQLLFKLVYMLLVRDGMGLYKWSLIFILSVYKTFCLKSERRSASFKIYANTQRFLRFDAESYILTEVELWDIFILFHIRILLFVWFGLGFLFPYFIIYFISIYVYDYLFYFLFTYFIICFISNFISLLIL